MTYVAPATTATYPQIVQINTLVGVDYYTNQNNVSSLPPVMTQPQPWIIQPVEPVTPENTCASKCFSICFCCDDDYSWYDVRGKGIFFVLLLVIGWLTIITVILAFLLVFIVCKIAAECSSNQESRSSTPSSNHAGVTVCIPIY